MDDLSMWDEKEFNQVVSGKMLAIPIHLRRGIFDYVVFGVVPGQFLTAVLANDLARAVTLADPESFAALKAIVSFIADSVPASANGSYDAVAAWVGEGGLRGS